MTCHLSSSWFIATYIYQLHAPCFLCQRRCFQGSVWRLIPVHPSAIQQARVGKIGCIILWEGFITFCPYQICIVDIIYYLNLPSPNKWGILPMTLLPLRSHMPICQEKDTQSCNWTDSSCSLERQTPLVADEVNERFRWFCLNLLTIHWWMT